MAQGQSEKPARATVPPLPQLKDQFDQAAEKLRKFISSVSNDSNTESGKLQDTLSTLASLHAAVEHQTNLFTSALERSGGNEEVRLLRKEARKLTSDKELLEQKLGSSASVPQDHPGAAESHHRPETAVRPSPEEEANAQIRRESLTPSVNPQESLAALEDDIEVELARIAFERTKLNVRERRARARTESLCPGDHNSFLRSSNSVRAWVDGGSQRALSDILQRVDNSSNAPGQNNIISGEQGRSRLLNPEADTFLPRHFQSTDGVPAAPTIDGATRYLLVADLKKTPSHPYSGEPHLFDRWLGDLQRKMRKLSVDPVDAMEILACHTVGEPLRLITTLSAAVSVDPERQYTSIVTELRRRFGSSYQVGRSLYDRLMRVPEIRGQDSDGSVALRLRELGDHCFVICQAIPTTPDLRVLDHAMGLEPVKKKLPSFVVSAWRKKRAKYLEQNSSHPPFDYFTTFLRDLANSLCLDIDTHSLDFPVTHLTSSQHNMKNSPAARAFLTNSEKNNDLHCLFHNTSSHDTPSCNIVANMESKKKGEFIRAHRLCYRCLGQHMASECQQDVKCTNCGAADHSSNAHLDRQQRRTQDHRRRLSSAPGAVVEREIDSIRRQEDEPRTVLRSSTDFISKTRSCSKTLLANVFTNTGESCRVYVIIDEQSTSSFCLSSLTERLGLDGPTQCYTISTLTGSQTQVYGRCISGLRIRGVTEDVTYDLPPLLENDMIPNTKNEVATRQMVRENPRISQYSDKFLPLDDEAKVSLLLGRDSGDLFSTLSYGTEAPFVHHTSLGWAVVGELCPLRNYGSATMGAAMKTCVADHDHFSALQRFAPPPVKDVFAQQIDDELPGVSLENQQFSISMKEIHVNKEGHSEAPLPLKRPDITLQDNRLAVFRRQRSTLDRVKRNQEKPQQCVHSTQKNIDARHVGEVPMNAVVGHTGSSCLALMRIAARVVEFCRHLVDRVRHGKNEMHSSRSISSGDLAWQVILREAQRSSYAEIMTDMWTVKVGPKHRLAILSPFIDDGGLLRVGGRLRMSQLPKLVKHPAFLPPDHPLGAAILMHYHRMTKHRQGRHITHSAVLEAGYHIEQTERTIRKLLQNWVICRCLRGSCEELQIADLPAERTLATPPFTSVGLDVFGHWMVGSGRSTRAVHVDSLGSLDTPTFVNAFRCFTALRGPCATLFLDRGSNFVGAKRQAEDIDMLQTNRTLAELGVTWKINPPHSSHFGGVWDREIDQMRRLDSPLMHARGRAITLYVLSPLIQEASCRVNSTPLCDTSIEPNDPVTPYNLITQKFNKHSHVPELTDWDLLACGPKRSRRVQLLADHFWDAWRKRYLFALNSRIKWKIRKPSLQVGNVVFIPEKNGHGLSWPVGMVEEVSTSHDGRNRTMTARSARTSSSSGDGRRKLERPASELVLPLRTERSLSIGSAKGGPVSRSVSLATSCLLLESERGRPVRTVLP